MKRRVLSVILVITLIVSSMLSGSWQNYTVYAEEMEVSYDFGTTPAIGINVEQDSREASNAKYVTKAGKSGLYLDMNQYAHFTVTNNAIAKEDTDLFFEITYFDEGSASFMVQYNSSDPTLTGNNQIFKTISINKDNSGKWVTKTVCVSDAALDKKMFNAYDFRLCGRDNAVGTVIGKIKIKKGNTNPDTEPIGNRTGGTAKSEFKGKSFAGYQGWFGTGDQYSSWNHYDYGGSDADGTGWPRKNHISIDYYPDVTDYADSSVAQTGFENLGNGNPAKLFDSKKDDVIDTHFKWMKQYGIDGAAVQRFSNVIKGKVMINTPEETQLYKIKTAAEKNDRLIYVMYDISGGTQITDTSDTTSISSYVEDIKFDWVYNIEKALELPNSKAYTTVDGKPVVCLWGVTVSGRPDRVVDYQELINFFHKRNCYVIIGVGRDWSTNQTTLTKYGDVLKNADMISPWLVGSNISSDSAIDGLSTSFYEPDVKWCKENNTDYYPVVFSGFSWGLWHENAKPNAMPRNAGQNFWYQAYKLKQLGLDSFYIAMFDEYDEGTAIAKNASDYFDIPKDQYFVTASCDGYWCSTDYQLRVAGESIKMVKGEREAVAKCPVAHSLGPVFYRNSFESRYATCPYDATKEGTANYKNYSGDYPVDPCFKNDKQLAANNATGEVKIEKNENSKTGDYQVAVTGNATANNATYKYQISETAITITKNMSLSYSIKPDNDLGKNVYVDLLLSDGTYVSNVSTTADAKKMDVGSGTVNQWTACTYQFGDTNLEGKKIIGVVVNYQGNAGDYRAYIDDVKIEDGSIKSGDAMDNLVVGQIYDRATASRNVNTDGLVGYQTYTRTLNINAGDVADENLAVSFKLYIDSETDTNGIRLLKDSPVGFIELATAYENGKIARWQTKNITTQADGSPLKSGEWNDIVIKLSDASKDAGFDKSNITFFNFCLAHLPKDTQKHTVRLTDVNVVDLSKPAEKPKDEGDYDTTYNVGTIPFTMDKEIKDSNYVGESKTFDAIDASDHNPKKLQLQMDVEINNTTNPGDFSALTKGAAQIELSSDGKSDSHELTFNATGINWTEGKSTVTLDFTQGGASGGEIDLSSINFMRVYFVHLPEDYKDVIKIKIDNVRIVDTTTQLILPTVFSDGMMFQQNKPINIYGYHSNNSKVEVKLYKGDQLIQQKQAESSTDDKWSVSLDSIKGSYDAYHFDVLENGTVVKSVNDILIGELWLSAGQSNMALNVGSDMDSEEILENAKNPNIRFFLEPTWPAGNGGVQEIDPYHDIPGAFWAKGDNRQMVSRASAVAYSFAKKLQENLNVPVGFYNTAVGGSVIEAWLPRECVENDEQVKKELKERDLYYDEDWWGTAGTMSTIYNQKVGPLIGENIAGVIWYQGESNSNRSEIYDIELSLLKKAWSEKFGFENNSLPFIFTQVAPGRYDTGATNNQHLGYLAESMGRAFTANEGKKTAMLTIYDIPLEHMKDGVSSDPIHPRYKQQVGERFCQSAMNMVYGGGKEYTAPIYDHMTIKGNAIYVTFRHMGGGLKTTTGTEEVHGFTIAGADGVFVNAKAKIVGNNTVKVWNDYLESPKNVIYAFDNFNQGANLTNSENIPAAPFRSINLNDTTLKPSTAIKYFNAQDWMLADNDVWVYNSANTENKSIGFSPSWKVTNGTYSYDSETRSEGTASLKVSYNGEGTVIAEPVLTYESLKFNLANYKNISVQVYNPDERVKNLGLNIISNGDTYAAQLMESDKITQSIDKENGFTTVTFDLTKLKRNNETVQNTDVLSNATGLQFTFTDSAAGSIYLDGIMVGRTGKIADEEPSEPETTTPETTTLEVSTPEATTPETTINGGLVNESTTENITTGKISVGKAKVKKATKKRSSKKVKLTLKKMKNIRGYKIQISKKKKFKKKNIIFIKNSRKVNKAKFTVKSKKLKNRKKLYVRVRVYIVVNGKKIYGKWSKAKKIKIRK